MSFLGNMIYDNGLNYLDANSIQLYICSQQPADYTEASATYSVGSAVINTGSATTGEPNGRQVTIPAVPLGFVTATGSAVYWAISGSDELHASGSLTASQVVTLGNTFTLTAFTIRIPAPA